MMRRAPTGLLIIHLLPILSPIFFSTAIHPSLAESTATGRRILHQPLFPIDYTPPLPDTALSNPPPPDSPNVPVQTPPTIPIASISSHSRTAKKIAIGISLSVAAVALLSVSAFFAYKQRASRLDDSEKMVGVEHPRRLPPTRQSAATSDPLYLGTMEPSTQRVDGDSNSSPNRKLTPAQALEVQPPSPELQPLPPLIRPPLRIDHPVAIYDEDVFYTPPRSAASITSDISPCSTVSQKSLPVITTGKDTVDCTSCSQTTYPKMNLSSCGSPEIKQAIPQSTGKPPPPPPPLPPRQPPPPPPEIGRRNRPPSEVSVLPLATQTSSRRQWVKPTSRSDVPIPIAGVSNGGSCSSSDTFDEEEDSVDRAKPRLKVLNWDKARASSD